jgi:hypothetical protein
MAKVTRKSKTPNRNISSSVLKKIRPVSSNQKFLSMVLYGRSGTGKTTLASSFPKKSLIIGAEDGTLSVHNVKGLDFIKIERSTDIVEVASVFNQYKTIILDSASSLQSLVLKEILGLDEIPVQNTWGMASRQDWMQVGIQVKEYLRLILGHEEAHRIIIAQERVFSSDDEESEIITPHIGAALSPSIVGWLNPEADYIGQTFIRDEMGTKKLKIKGEVKIKKEKTGRKEYCLRVGPDSVYTTKFRRPKSTNELPDVLVDPSYEKISKLIG